MMTMTCIHSSSRSVSLLVLVSALGLGACDLGPKAIGDQPDTDTGEDDLSDESDESEESDEGTDSTDDGYTDPNFPGSCGEETESIITDLAEVPAGFESSVADILAQADGLYEGTFTWNQNDGPVTVTHAGTSSPLTIDLNHIGGEIRLTEVEFAGEFPDGQEGGEPCSNRLEIDVALHFSTEDGVFDTLMTAPLRADSHSEDPGPRLYLELNLVDMHSHMGSLSMDDFAFADAMVEALILTANFSGVQSQGGLGMQVLSMDWVGFGGVASFTADLVVGP
jgi:hypothetical protein